jgi:hypothetical protein
VFSEALDTLVLNDLVSLGLILALSTGRAFTGVSCAKWPHLPVTNQKVGGAVVTDRQTDNPLFSSIT